MGRWRQARIWGSHAAIIVAALILACLSGLLAFDRDQNGRDNSGVRLALVKVPLLPECFRPPEEAT